MCDRHNPNWAYVEYIRTCNVLSLFVFILADPRKLHKGQGDCVKRIM